VSRPKHKWWAVFKKRTKGFRTTDVKVTGWEKNEGDQRVERKNERIDAVNQPPVLSIQTAPVNEGQEKPVSITIREVDTWDEQKSSDDEVAYFEGHIFRTAGRYYFRQNHFRAITNAKPGPEIDFYFEAPGGKTDGPYKFRLTGDELEKSEWELGWQIRHGFTDLAESDSLVRISHSNYNTETAFLKLKVECMSYLDRIFKRLVRAATLWEAFALQYAVAYHTAYANVTAALKKAEEDAAKEDFLKELVFEMLSLVSGGAVERLFDWAKGAARITVLKQKKKRVKKVQEDAPKEFFSAPEKLAEFYSGKGLDKFKEKWNGNSPELKLDAIDPLRFHLELSARVKTIFAHYMGVIEDVNNEVATHKDEEFTNLDLQRLQQGLDEFLGKSASDKGLKYHVMTLPHSSIPFLGKADQPEQPSFQRTLEMGLWSIWLPGLESKADDSSVFSKGDLEYSEPPAAVIARLKSTGILKAAGVDPAKEPWVHRTNRGWDGGARKLVEWARNWQNKEAVEADNVFSKTEPPPGTDKEPTGIWKTAK
jgi:hypothetical protein